MGGAARASRGIGARHAPPGCQLDQDSPPPAGHPPRLSQEGHRRGDAGGRAGADAVHGLGYILRVRFALRRGDDPRAGKPDAHERADQGWIRLPVAGRRLVAGGSQCGRGNHREPDPVAARDDVADTHAARSGAEGGPVHRRGHQRLRWQRAGQLRPLPAGREHVREVGLRRGEGGLLRGHPAAPRPGERVRRIPRSDRAQFQQPPDAAVGVRLPAARPVRKRSADARKLRLLLLHIRAERRQQLAHGHRRGRAGRRGIQLGAAQPRRGRRQPRSGGAGPLERPRLPRPRPRDVGGAVPYPVQHVGDAGSAADDQ